MPQEEYGILSYGSAEPATGPPLMVLVVAAFLVVAGALVWWKQKWPWLFDAFELTLLVSIMATKAFQDRNDHSRDLSPAR